MLPSKIDHYGTQYDLQHLTGRLREFNWQCQDGQTVTFRVRVHCSNHCVSEELTEDAPRGAGCFSDHNGKVRIFNPDRHAWSQELPNIIDSLFDKPTTQIRLTIENNWYLFQIHMRHPLPNGNRYYCFLRARYLEKISDDPQMHFIHLQIESAYSRDTPPLTPHGNERSMFGRLIERLMLAKN